VVAVSDTNTPNNPKFVYSSNRGAILSEPNPSVRTLFFGSVEIKGNNVIAGSSAGTGLYYSTNKGVNLLQSNIKSGSFNSIAISSNGLIAVAGSSSGSGIYSSANGGQTWTQTNINTENINSVEISNNYLSVVGSSSDLGIYYTPAALCFNHDTKILCWSKEEGEKYIAIQDLRKGDFVKSYLHGYRKIQCIGKNTMINNAKFWNLSMWKMEKTDTNNLIEDLIVLGGHALLVDSLSEEIQEKYKENNCFDGISPVIDGKFLLISAYSSLFTQIKEIDFYTYYQLTLDNEGDVNRRFGVWANGVLVETPCEEQFHKIKWDEL
jgi:hypothetical protein